MARKIKKHHRKREKKFECRCGNVTIIPSHYEEIFCTKCNRITKIPKKWKNYHH